MSSSSHRAPKRSRSSARSTASNGVPRIRQPSASISRASFSGVWPPNWMTTPSGELAGADLEHLLRAERLEVEAVRRVVVGRDRLRVAVDHHGLVAERPEGLGGMDAAVVELDPLADPVRAGAEDDDAGFRPVRAGLVRFAPGRVEVVRIGLDLGGAGVDSPVDGPDPAPSALRPRDVLGRSGLGRDRRIREAEALEPHPVVENEVVQLVDSRIEPFQLSLEPRMRSWRQFPRIGAVELARAPRLEEGLAERAADPHRLAHRLHLRPQRRVRARELLEGEARELDDDVVERRLEARGGRPGQVVRDLVQRVPDRELGGDLRDRITRRLRGQRRGA